MSSRLLFITPILASLTFFVSCAADKHPLDPPPQSDGSLYEICPTERGERAPLTAAVVRKTLDLPVGTSLGSYVIRSNPYYDDPRFSGIIGSSHGYYDHLPAQALLLDRGDRRVIMATAPLSTITDSIRSAIIDRVYEKTGENICGELLLTAGHTHSGPARTMPLPEMFSFVGLDTTQAEIYNRVADQLAELIIATIEAAPTPVKIGYGVSPDFDPDDQVTVDRRCANNNLYKEEGLSTDKDRQLVVIRLDRADDGRPFAALVNFAVHGTVFIEDNFYFSADMPGMVETKVREAMLVDPQIAEAPPVLFFNGAAGETNPWNAEDLGYLGPNDLAQAIRNAEIAAPAIIELYKNIDNLTTDPELYYRVRRVELSRKALGYKSHEWQGISGEPVEMAGYCAPIEVDCAADEKYLWPDDLLSCLLDFTDWYNNQPEYVAEYTRANVGLLRIGGLTIAALPGETTTPAADAVRRAAAEHGLDGESTAIFGYANHYLFYLTLEKDFFRGGYEAAANVWGPNFGQYLVDNVDTLIAESLGDVAPLSSLARPQYLPLDSEHTDDFIFEIFTTSNPGVFYRQSPARAERMEVVETAFYGGDPAVDMPRFIVEQKTASGDWTALIGDDGRPVDESSYRTRVDLGWSRNGSAVEPWALPTKHPPEGSTELGKLSGASAFVKMIPQAGDQPIWTISWALRPDEAIGEYRFAIYGRAATDAGGGETATIDYGTFEAPLYGDVIEVIASTAIEVTQLVCDAVTGEVNFRAEIPGDEKRFLQFDPARLPADSLPVREGSASIVIEFPDGASVDLNADAVGDGNFSADFNPGQTGDYVVRIDAGNITDKNSATNGKLYSASCRK